MKILEVLNEGPWDDLKALGRANQAQVGADLKQAFSTFKGDITPDWYKNFSDKIAKARSDQNTDQLVNAWAAAWEKEFKSMEGAHGKPFSDDEYRGLLRGWIEKTAKVNVADGPLKTFVTVQSTEAVKDYLKNHFIPGYLKAQSNPVFIVPNGTVVDTQTTVGKKTTTVKYTWDSTKGRFVDPKGAEVPTYTQLHGDLLQQAMDQATAKSTGVTTIGGGGAATI